MEKLQWKPINITGIFSYFVLFLKCKYIVCVYELKYFTCVHYILSEEKTLDVQVKN